MFGPKIFSLLCAFLLISANLEASPLKIQSSSVNFQATGKPGFLKINGSGGEAQGHLEIEGQVLKGDLTVAMEKFVTGIGMRDSHMKEKYLEVGKYPEATLIVQRLELDPKGLASDAPFTGRLKFHGVEKDVSGLASLTRDGSKVLIDATFPLTLSDFKIEIPSYAGVKVADKVVVEAKIQAEPE